MKDYNFGDWTFQFARNDEGALESVAYKYRSCLIEPMLIGEGGTTTLIKASKRFASEVKYVPGKGWSNC